MITNRTSAKSLATVAAAAAAAIVTSGIAVAGPAHGAGAGHREQSALTAHAVHSQSHKKPFTVRAGNDYVITARLSGIKHGMRFAVEDRVSGQWSLLPGSYALHAHQKKIHAKAETGPVGLFTLRSVILNSSRHVVPGSASNTFRVRVTGRSVSSTDGPGSTNDNDSAAKAKPATFHAQDDSDGVLSDWNGVSCAVPGLGLSESVNIVPPVARMDGSEWVNQVVWSRDGAPGGTWGPWYIAENEEQYIQPAQQNIIVLNSNSDLVDSSYLNTMDINYGSATEYHQIAWDLQVYGSDDLWHWVNPTTSYSPAYYNQYDVHGNGPTQSPDCYTLHSNGY